MIGLKYFPFIPLNFVLQGFTNTESEKKAKEKENNQKSEQNGLILLCHNYLDKCNTLTRAKKAQWMHDISIFLSAYMFSSPPCYDIPSI